MSETMMLNLIGVFGLILLVLGIWLIWIDKKILKRLSNNPTLADEILFNSRRTGGRGTKQLGLVCVATGIVLIAIFGITISGFY